MQAAKLDNQQTTRLEHEEDQYRRPSCRPISSPEELREALGPGTSQLLKLLNQL